MEKTIGDAAKLMKEHIAVNIPETYSINAMFRDICEEEKMRTGVLAFREFLYKFYDCLIFIIQFLI